MSTPSGPAPAAVQRGARPLSMDFLIGAGGAYLLSVPLLLLAFDASPSLKWPWTVTWIVTIGINGAHYGATLLRVYEGREERRKYRFVAVWVTIALAAVFTLGVYNVVVGSLLLTLYFTWSPWHFAGQNYGIAVMFLKRSGVEIHPVAKRALHISFVLSFILAFLALHIEGASSVYAPVRTESSYGIDMIRLGIPYAWAHYAMLGFGVAYLACLVAAGVILLRSARVTQLLPVAALVASQALWFAVPAINDIVAPGSGRSLAFTAVWLSAAHSLQYLWITTNFARRRDPSAKVSTYLLKATLVGNAAFTIPGLLFSTSLLRNSTWHTGLAMLIFAVVNLHHFILDGAIWKLRDGAVSRTLLGNSEPGNSSVSARTGFTWRPAAFLALCALCFTIDIGDYGWRQAEKNGAPALASRMLDYLDLFARDNQFARVRLGRKFLAEKNFDRARHEFSQSLLYQSTAAAHGGVGRSYAGQGDTAAAVAAYERGLHAHPDDSGLLMSASAARIRLGQPERAIETLEHALELDPSSEAARNLLKRARTSLKSR